MNSWSAPAKRSGDGALVFVCCSSPEYFYDPKRCRASLATALQIMNKSEVLKRIRDTGLIPVVRAESSDQALCAVAALQAGGLNVLEITMTVPGAVEVIRTLAAECGPETLIGAGTVLDPETAQACIQAGAQFIVSFSASSGVAANSQPASVPSFQRNPSSRPLQPNHRNGSASS